MMGLSNNAISDYNLSLRIKLLTRAEMNGSLSNIIVVLPKDRVHLFE